MRCHLPRPSPPLRFSSPCIALGTSLDEVSLQILHTSVQFAGIHGGLDKEVLGLGELCAQLGVLNDNGED
ncbi:hypothetical protein EKPJFOCH_3855 [Methylobacterium thuringiense]|uniref:Uncharacterized protein n=1 Tax=Methylobacterium thuringiense TaxID=1003091 RepID=A0ABQ4TQR4_9HYPH|nr:hypothetical protein EKPJFOCH_3855 [Methylobacterium thuringiense]